jgi:hypothetical protein
LIGNNNEDVFYKEVFQSLIAVKCSGVHTRTKSKVSDHTIQYLGGHRGKKKDSFI